MNTGNTVFVLLVLLTLTFLMTFTNATETGQYRYYPYATDFNINDLALDLNSILDISFVNDCNITAKYEPTSTKVLDENLMLNDPIIAANYYIEIPGHDINTWKRGKYQTFIYCNYLGTPMMPDDVSFIIDYETNQLIIDSNSIGKGLNADQNSLLYDINLGVQGLYDNNAPIIKFNYPTNGSMTSSDLVKISFYDYSFLSDVNLRLNGLDAPDFNQVTQCYYFDNNKTCAYSETNFVLNAWNDLNVIVTDDKGNISYQDSNFYYTTPTPTIITSPSSNGFQLYLLSPVKLEDFNFFIENQTESGFTLHSFSKKAGLTSFDYNLSIYNLDQNTTPMILNGTVNIGVGEQKNSIGTPLLPQHYYLELSMTSNATTFILNKEGYNWGVFSWFANNFFSGTAFTAINGVPLNFAEIFILTLLFVIIIFIVKRHSIKNRVVQVVGE